MKNKVALKKGITLTSLVIYIILFSSFTLFVANVSTNLNSRLFNSRGQAINYTNFNKLQYNLENSSLESDSLILKGNEISYSNGDTYTYDRSKGMILKNGGILCLNVSSFKTSYKNNTTIKIDISFNKYLNDLKMTIINNVEEF